MLAGIGMLQKTSGWEVKNIISNYSKMLLENPSRYPGASVDA